MRNCFQNKVSNLLINSLDIDNILDNNAQKIFFKNISVNNNKNAQISEKTEGKSKNRLSDYLKKGHLDYSLDSNSNSNIEEKPKSINEQKKHRKQNFILKSELFNSPNNDKKNQSEKVSPKSSILK